jgi:VanZ family protein
MMEVRHFTRWAQLVAWASIAVIAYLTMTRVSLVYAIYYDLSPMLLHLGMKKFAAIEHFVAFALFGALLYAAYPKRVLMVFCVVFGSAITLELMQTLTPDRHGTLLDALEKIAGGACGILIAKAALNLWNQRRPVQSDV